jgi:hypothetical protein
MKSLARVNLCAGRVRSGEAYGDAPVRRSLASASISTFISAFSSPVTTIIVAAGRISPNTSPWTFRTASKYALSVTKVLSRTMSASPPPACLRTAAKVE